MDKAIGEIISRFREALKEQGIPSGEIILFGSYAQNNPHESSDIDLVVISENFRGKDFWERGKIIAKAVCRVFKPIEALAYTPDEWEKTDSILSQIVRETGLVVPG